MNKDYQNILIIALRKIGDTIIATSGAYLLRQAYPTAKITMLVRPLTQTVVENNPVVDEVMVYNYTHQSSFQEMRGISREIRQKEFDLCIVLDNKPRSAMLAWMAGIPKRVGFEKIEFRNVYLKLFYTDIIKIDYDASSTQQVKNHEIFINRFTGRMDTAKMVMSEPMQSGKEKVENLIAKGERPSAKKIALCVRSGCKTKDWPLERFAAVIDAVAQARDATFYVIGSKADIPYAKELQTMTGVQLNVVCGETSLAELAYFIGKMDLFLSVDTGSAHIAATTDTPLVVLYGSTSPDKWGPYTKNIINIIPQKECHPCDGKKIHCDEPICLETIQAEQVTKACLTQLRGTEGLK